MPRRKVVKTLSSDSSEDDQLSRKQPKKDKELFACEDNSSSESDISNYLKPGDKIDLDSPFFGLQNENLSLFDKIENDIFAGVSKLSSDSDSDNDETSNQPTEESVASKLDFQHYFQEYSKKIEEVKACLEKYEIKKQNEEKDKCANLKAEEWNKDKNLDIANLLAAGEGKDKQELLTTGFHPSDFETDGEGWEEVADQEKKEERNSLLSKEGVQITVNLPGVMVKKKKGIDLMAAIKRRINRVRKENQVLVHKVHLLCWIAHGNYVSSVINSQNILSLALSLLPSEKCYPSNRTDLTYMEQVVKWYRNAVVNVNKMVPRNKNLEKLLEEQITKKEAYNKKMLVLIFIAIMRSLGIQCRLVLSFQVEPIRPPSNEVSSLNMKNDINKEVNTSKIKTETCSQIISKLDSSGNQKKPHSVNKKKATEKNKNTPATKTDLNRQFKNRKPTSSKEKPIPLIPQVDGANDSKGASTSKPNLKKLKIATNSSHKNHPKRLKTKLTKYKDTDSEDDSTRSSFSTKNKESGSTKLEKLNASSKVTCVNLKKLKNIPLMTVSQPGQSKFFSKKPLDVRSDIVNLVKSRIKEQKQIDRTKVVKKRRSAHDSDENSDYAPESNKKKRPDSDDEVVPKIKVKRRVPVKPEEQDKVLKKQGLDIWAEVFLETEENWISVDVVKGLVHCVNELYNRASHPVSYILAWNNNNCLKDVTRRYCHNFNTITRKLRVDAKWWEATLKPFLAPKTSREREEDEEFERQQLDKPLPTSITEYKNHPLYVLKRHLLKFQAIYPSETPPLGFVKGEAVYARFSVHTLHSREVWLKHAKVVKPGEQPYKVVKGRARYDKLSNSRIADPTVEIFGSWQTEDYVPPTAENGKVPRNAYGNVELFKPCMLPKHTVHLQLPGLHKIAKRLDIDCAPAVVGFDFHSGGSHPTFDGFVVCEEFKDVLVDAWEAEQEELVQKEREKVEKRVYGNWKKLIKGLLIRERLKKKYDFGDFSGIVKKKRKVN